MLRVCAGVLLALLVAQTALAQAPPDRIRFGFFPPLNTDIVYRIDYHGEEKLDGTPRVVDWSHEVLLRISSKEADGIHNGTFSLRAVTAQKRPESDVYNIIARALEGETFTVQLQSGVPVKVGWPAIKERLRKRLPEVTDARMAQMIVQAFPVFEPDGVSAVLRPFWVTAIGYLRAFNRDGSSAVFENLDVPSWFQIPGSTLTIRGGNEEGTKDLLMIWTLKSDAKTASQKLGPELRKLAETVASPADRPRVQAMLDKLLAGEVEAIEGGSATFDPTPGLMRHFQLFTRLSVGEFRRETKLVIKRVTPD
jgi:hypothetical protein